jgi:hypothetical protein
MSPLAELKQRVYHEKEGIFCIHVQAQYAATQTSKPQESVTH